MHIYACLLDLYSLRSHFNFYLGEIVASSSQSIPCAVFGASGYTGIELAWLLHQHPHFHLVHAFTSSARTAEAAAALYPQLQGRLDVVLQPWHSDLLIPLGQQVRVVFLALPHEASAEIAPQLIEQGITVFDLSGAFRLRDETLHQATYGFTRELAESHSVPYGIAEFTQLKGTETLVAVAGCYPTAAGLGLKPITKRLRTDCTPFISAVSGVSGAGRKANLTTQFAEVSLQAYGVTTHRHQPEISQFLERDVVFVPHLGNFKRGIVATIYAQLADDVSVQDVESAFLEAYESQPLVRLVKQPPAQAHIERTPFADVYWQVQNQHVVVCVAIDNLLKGAASQAVQLTNQYFGLSTETGLLQSTGVV